MVEIQRVQGDGPKLRILHLHLEVGEQSEANQFVHPSRHDVTVVTFFPCRIQFPDYVTLHDGDGTFQGFRRALRAAEGTGPYDIVHPHGPIDGALYLLFCHWTGRRLGRLVYTAHHSLNSVSLKRRNLALSVPVFAASEMVCGVGKASLASFSPFFRWLARGRLRAVPNGVNLTRLDAALAEEPEQGRQGFTVASVGRLIPKKNPFTVLEAFSGMEGDDLRLFFVGTGELGEPLKDASASDDRVTLTGEIARNDVYRFFGYTADVFISASYGEGLPLATLEAMAARCPVILSDIPPHREIAEGHDFIPLLASDDTEGFRRELERFRRMSADERRGLGELCREVVVNHFSLEGMHRGYDRVYYDVLGLETDVVTNPRAANGSLQQQGAQ